MGRTSCYLTVLLLVAVSLPPATCDQLQKLLNFVSGGGNNPAPAAAIHSHSPAASYGGRANVVPPIPFAEVADPSRGVVPLDVPQPKGAQFPIAPPANPTLEQVRRIPGVPGGATQVGGSPVKTKSTPTPLNEVEAPIFLSTTFPSPLNDVDPHASAAVRREPEAAMQHRLRAGTVPRPSPVPHAGIPYLAVLAHPVGQQAADTDAHNYHRFGQQIFKEPALEDAGSQQLDGQHVPRSKLHQGFLQVDNAHSEALKKHKENVEKVRQLQREFQHPHHHQQQHQKQGQHQHEQADNQFASQFRIPGQEQHRIYTEELRLAEEALKRLG